jgi:hypothetical protein
VRTDLEKALKGAPHALSIAEAALLGDGLDRYDGLFEFAGAASVRARSANCAGVSPVSL